jgi:hypothetical protein
MVDGHHGGGFVVVLHLWWDFDGFGCIGATFVEG